MDLINVLKAEKLKLKNMKIIWITFLIFGMGPIFGGLIFWLLKNPEFIPESGILNMKLTLLATELTIIGYFDLLLQVNAIAGVLLFGFIISFIFGREYEDKTYRDLLSLPVKRTNILNAKFLIYIIWTILLSLSNLLIFFIIALLLDLAGWELTMLIHYTKNYFIITAMIMVLGTIISFFTLWSKNYFIPLGILVLLLIFSQIIPIVGLGHYFPWSIPAIYSGAAGELIKERLNNFSFLFVFITSIIGYIMTLHYWNTSDHY